MAGLLGEQLVAAQVIDQAGLNRALQRQQHSGERLASACLSLGLACEEDLARILSRQLGQPFVVLSRSVISRETLARLPAQLARALPALPVQAETSELVVALTDPANLSLKSEVILATGAHLVPQGALAGPLAQAAENAYRNPDQGFVGNRVKPGGTSGPHFVSGHNNSGAKPAPHSLIDNLEPEPVWPAPQTVPIQSLCHSDRREETVLVVEDDQSIRHMICQFLKKKGHQVLEAPDGYAAVDHLQRYLPDAILLDAMLPGVHGFDICRMLKMSEITRAIPVIMISAVYRGQTSADEIRLQHGANAFLEKPLKLAELERVLGNCLRSRPAHPDLNLLHKRLNEFLRQAAQAANDSDHQAYGKALAGALNIAPFVATLHYRMALYNLSRDKTYRAIDNLEWTQRLHPNQPTQQLLAQAYTKAGFIARAREAWNKLLNSTRDSVIRNQIKRRLALLDSDDPE